MDGLSSATREHLMKRRKVGVIGCGNISGIYFKNLTGPFAGAVELTACADLDPARARAKAEEFPGVSALTVEQLLADPEIEIIANLTIPKAHFEIAMAAIDHGKHVYSEKPLTLSREQGRRLLAAAKARKLRVANAPDTFLGAAHQTCRKLIDTGAIGTPVAATAFMLCRGHESWHPDPEFYYQSGGGPMLDMGPYYLTALVNLLGPVSRVTGSARATFATRTITSEKKNGTIIPVETPTHLAGVLDFAQGAVATVIMSFDVWRQNLPRIEIYGSEGSLAVPDPNGFGGDVRLWTPATKEWTIVPHSHPHPENSRGIGIADLASALESGQPHGAGGELALHVLDVMLAVEDASSRGRHVIIESPCGRPPPQPEQSRWA